MSPSKLVEESGLRFRLKIIIGTSLAVQWLRDHLPAQGDVGSTPGLEAKIPHASGKKKQANLEQKQYCNKFNKDFRKVHIKKKK